MSYRFIPTGSTLLDLILSGGYALGRIVHVVGDPSTGKTQLAIEACANFHRTYGGKIAYVDSEAAFDPDYAAKLGLPVSNVEFIKPADPKNGITLEDFDATLEKFVVDVTATKKPGLMILDSMDALPTLKEATTNIQDATGYGAEKSKEFGKIFRRMAQKLDEADICLFLISQTRDNLNAMFGPKKIFSGGNAPKFYASQRLMLQHLKRLSKQVNNIDMPWGVRIGAKCDKNKCGIPFKDCEYTIIFNYGIDDLTNNLEFLKSIKATHRLPQSLIIVEGEKPVADPKKKSTKTDTTEAKVTLTDDIAVIKKRIEKITDKNDKRDAIASIAATVHEVWNEAQDKLEASLPSGKYAEV